jgi:hypothetical protein
LRLLRFRFRSLDQVQEDLWTAKDNIRSRCDVAWEFLTSTSAIEETVAIVRAQVQEELDKFAANEKVQALTSDDRAFVLEELHQYAKNLKFLVTSACDVLPDIIDEFEAIAGRLLDDNEEVKVLHRRNVEGGVLGAHRRVFPLFLLGVRFTCPFFRVHRRRMC